jgi:hypothetical protein
MSELSEKRVVSVSAYLDLQKKTVRLLSSGVAWLDTQKYALTRESPYELEYLLPGGRSVRGWCSSIGIQDPSETPTDGEVHGAVITDEDGIGYRIWNRTTGELLGEEMLSHPSAPPMVELSGIPTEGLRVKVDRKVTSIMAFCSTDQGQTWQPFPVVDINGKEPTPSRMLPSETSIRKGGMLVETRVMVGLKLYLDRFQIGGAENQLKSSNWKRLKGGHPPIQQKTIMTVVQDKDR